MALDMFMVFADDKTKLEGEAKDKVFEEKKAIDVLAWSWGASNSGSFHVGGGGGAGKANVQDLSFTKYIDNASTALVLAVCKGTHIEKATLSVRKAGDKPLVYVEILMENVLITSVSTGGSGGEDRLTDNVSLNFQKFELTYYKQNKDGTGTKVGPVKYDMALNSE